MSDGNDFSKQSTWQNPLESSSPMTNGDREPYEKRSVTLLTHIFLKGLGKIPGSMPLTEVPILPALPKSRSPIDFNFRVNPRASKIVQEAQKLLANIYNSYHAASHFCLEIIQRAHWIDASQGYAYTMRAKKEMEINYLRYQISPKYGREGGETD